MFNLKKAAYRTLRYHALTERAQNALRREAAVAFPEIGLVVPCDPDDIIIDAGANVGDVTSRCARTGATVHAFEPDPVCYRILARRFAALSNVHVHHCGVLDRNCVLTLSTPAANDHYDAVESTVASSFFASSEGKKVEVPCIDLAEFIRGLGKPVALLKMDIEGAEIPTLNHLLDTGVIEQVRMAIVETHERFSPEAAVATDELRDRIDRAGLSSRVRLDWI